MKTSKKKQIEKIRQLFEKRGKDAYEVAKKEILKEKIDCKPLRDALQYFMQEIWHNFQHPALLSLACESVGGKPEKTTPVGAALILLTGAADIHDDIIDKSKIKGSKLTILGKFGNDVALLVGDALLLKGFMLLHEACSHFPKEQGETILKFIKEAFFEIGISELKEASFKGNLNLSPEEYFEIIMRKVAIAEATTRIGAILGGGSLKEIEALSEYGRTLGMLAIIRDEFIDVYESQELKNRTENECLPLPILCAFRNQKAKNEVVKILRKRQLKEKDASKIVEIITETDEVKALKSTMNVLIKRGIQLLGIVKNKKIRKELRAILRAAVEDL